MKILAIETTGKYAGVCIGIGEDNIFCKTDYKEMQHLSCVLPMATELLTENNLKIEDIDALAISEGPGSFTGMRIGIAFVRAISQARGIKCIGVNTLAAFCFAENLLKEEAEFCIPMLDARRGQVYAALYRCESRSNAIPEEELATDVYMLDDFLHILEKYILKKKSVSVSKFFITGNASIKYVNELQNFVETLKKEHEIEVVFIFEQTENVEQNACNIFKLARLMYEENQFIKYGELTPVYLRKAEAERKLERAKQEELEKASDVISI